MRLYRRYFYKFGLPCTIACLLATGAVVSKATAKAAPIRTLPGKAPTATGLTILEVLSRCRRTYDNIQSYQGLVRVRSVSKGVGAPRTYNTSAQIKFVYPGKIRISGDNMYGGKYAFVSDGKATWSLRRKPNSHWEREESAEMAIAGATGISMNAATVLPAIFMRTQWGIPKFIWDLRQGKQIPDSARKAVTKIVDNRLTYQIKRTNRDGSITYLIDAKTFLIVEIHDESRNLVIDHSIENGSINATIPATEFASPAAIAK